MSCSYNVHLGFLVNTVFLRTMEWFFSFKLCTCWHHIKVRKLCSYYLLLIKYSDSIKWQQWSRWKEGSVCYYSSRVMIIATFKVTQWYFIWKIMGFLQCSSWDLRLLLFCVVFFPWNAKHLVQKAHTNMSDEDLQNYGD